MGLKVSGIGFDTKNKIITKEDTYNLGDKVVKVEELQTRDLGKFIRVTEFKNGKKIRCKITHLDKDVFEREAKDSLSEKMKRIFMSCDED